jgi:hypothetical protein
MLKVYLGAPWTTTFVSDSIGGIRSPLDRYAVVRARNAATTAASKTKRRIRAIIAPDRLFRLLLQQFVEGGLRIFGDHQTVCGPSRLAGFPLWLWLALTHSGILKTVPRPGFGPGRLVRSPACKAGLSANSSTGAQLSAKAMALSVGTGGHPKPRTRPDFSRAAQRDPRSSFSSDPPLRRSLRTPRRSVAEPLMERVFQPAFVTAHERLLDVQLPRIGADLFRVLPQSGENASELRAVRQGEQLQQLCIGCGHPQIRGAHRPA